MAPRRWLFDRGLAAATRRAPHAARQPMLRAPRWSFVHRSGLEGFNMLNRLKWWLVGRGVLAVWTWRAGVSWPDWPGRRGSFGGTFIAPRLSWLARRIATARASHQRRIDNVVDLASLHCEAS
jgi:hypothetical protein